MGSDKLRQKLEELTKEMRERTKHIPKPPQALEERNRTATFLPGIENEPNRDHDLNKIHVLPSEEQKESEMLPPKRSVEKFANIHHEDAEKPKQPIKEKKKVKEARKATIEDFDAIDANIPVRDIGPSVPNAEDRLKEMVNEMFLRHQSDLEAIRRANIEVDVPVKPDFGQISTSSRPVPSLKKRASGKESRISDQETPPKIHFAETPEPPEDPFNFLMSVKRKEEMERAAKNLRMKNSEASKEKPQKKQPVPKIAEQANESVSMSEGPLSTSFASSVSAVALENQRIKERMEKSEDKRERGKRNDPGSNSRNLTPSQGSEKVNKVDTEKAGSSLVLYETILSSSGVCSSDPISFLEYTKCPAVEIPS